MAESCDLRQGVVAEWAKTATRKGRLRPIETAFIIFPSPGCSMMTTEVQPAVSFRQSRCSGMAPGECVALAAVTQRMVSAGPVGPPHVRAQGGARKNKRTERNLRILIAGGCQQAMNPF